MRFYTLRTSDMPKRRRARMFQPFLRFYGEVCRDEQCVKLENVSTLLEILRRGNRINIHLHIVSSSVSTLLEILPPWSTLAPTPIVPQVSTLLEILRRPLRPVGQTRRYNVSTLLEILQVDRRLRHWPGRGRFQPFLRFYRRRFGIRAPRRSRSCFNPS